jgi:hypothetical protein
MVEKGGDGGPQVAFFAIGSSLNSRPLLTGYQSAASISTSSDCENSCEAT